MSLGQSDRLLLAADAEARAWPVTAKVADVTDAARFPNIAAAIASLSPERRAEIDREWEQGS